MDIWQKGFALKGSRPDFGIGYFQNHAQSKVGILPRPLFTFSSVTFFKFYPAFSLPSSLTTRLKDLCNHPAEVSVVPCENNGN